ncbi:uncharacterized protein LOC133785629 [Humulus lupulus]|uniref:uncharacterized protein LOC133785629 n=1 Tax=Humulus lupulus TaxID=3486 RepID=UPI002B40920D|nr:uncharacterized protein LOC133785629 [Humulus lupulus]
MAYRSRSNEGNSSVSQVTNSELDEFNIEVESNEKSHEDQVGNWLQEEEETDEHQQGYDIYLLARDRTRRKIKPPERYGYADLIAFSLVAASEVLEEEPSSFKAAINNKEKERRLKAMNEEMKSLHDNHTWSLVKRPAESRVLFVLSMLKPRPSEIDYYCALIEDDAPFYPGLGQDEEDETPTNFENVAEIAAEVAKVANTFVDSSPDDEDSPVPSSPTPSAPTPSKPGCVVQGLMHIDVTKYMLRRRRQFYLEAYRQDVVVMNIVFSQVVPDHYNAYHNAKEEDKKRFLWDADVVSMITVEASISTWTLNVYDSDVTVISEKQLQSFMKSWSTLFPSLLLQSHIFKDNPRLMIPPGAKRCKEFKEAYLKKVLNSFGMLIAKPIVTPISQQFKLSINQAPKTHDEQEYMKDIPYANAIGSLMYAMVCTRPDIAYVLSLEEKGQLKLKALWILTMQAALTLENHSQSMYSLLMKELLLNSRCKIKSSLFTVIIRVQFTYPKNQVYHKRTKHVDIKLQFVREVISNGSVIVEKVSTDHNPSDKITKVLQSSKFFHYLNLIQLQGD